LRTSKVKAGLFCLLYGIQLLSGNQCWAVLHPAGGQVGTSVEIIATGKHDEWPAQLWSAHKGLKLEALEKKGYFKATISKEAKTGPILIRILDKKQVSTAFTFVISKQKETLETEPNNQISNAQKIKKIPTLINGRLEKKGDMDFYHIQLKKGQVLSAKLDGYSLRSPIDPFLHIHGPDGYETAIASDTHNLDPHLIYKADESGQHTLQVFAIKSKASADISFTGTSDAVYRLELILGLPSMPEMAVNHEDCKTPSELAVPVTCAGHFSKPGEKNEFKFKADKGSQVQIRIEAHQLHYPTDPVMYLYDSSGKLIKEIDDNKTSRDPSYLLKVGSKEPYGVEVAERYGRSGKAFRYRLVLETPEPDFSPTLAKDIHILKEEKTLEIKIQLNRTNGHKTPLYAEIVGLPEGLQMEGLDIPADAKDATFKMQSDINTPTGHHPFQIRVTEKSEGQERQKLAIYSFQTAASRGDYLINDTNQAWLSYNRTSKQVQDATKIEKKQP
jgi:hypothetical protein